jgi:hypothetical protein
LPELEPLLESFVLPPPLAWHATASAIMDAGKIPLRIDTRASDRKRMTSLRESRMQARTRACTGNYDHPQRIIHDRSSKANRGQNSMFTESLAMQKPR